MLSYTHDSIEHKRRVLNLADKLRDGGIDCHLDQYEVSPPEGWPRWMIDQVQNAGFVLVVCTENYYRRFRGHGEPGSGLGAAWEGFVITQELFENAGKNIKFIPVLFNETDAQYIPDILRGSTYYRVDLDEGYDDLYRRLTEQPRVKKPPLGKKRVLAPINPVEAAVFPPAPTIAAEVDKVDGRDASVSAKTVDNLTLLFLDDGRFIYLPSARIEQSEQLKLELLPDDARKTAFLSDLDTKYNRREIAVAFRNTAVHGHLQSATTLHDERGETWRLVVNPTDDRYSPLMDFTFNNYTPEDIAELRAKRILLNEEPARSPGRDRLTDGLVEAMIDRGDGFIKQIRSPIPELYRMFSERPGYFLAAARLMCTLYLKLSGTVEHVLKLDLNISSPGEIEVEFLGQRRPRYANQDPYSIAFGGRCKLSK